MGARAPSVTLMPPSAVSHVCSALGQPEPREAGRGALSIIGPQHLAKRTFPARVCRRAGERCTPRNKSLLVAMTAARGP